ncbi:recombinase family protein [Streptomyces benahoarensis]|uniref:recombinase family protein n=1 Tax=Streptomyces benahoarensis TaxID=2595054 RepID=UPI003D80349D
MRRGKLSVVRLVPDPREAPVVRDAVTWALEGLSASSIARRLNDAGVPTKNANDAARLTARRARAVSEPSKASAWTSSTVLRILRDPRLAGYAIEWQGRTIKTKDTPGAAGKRTILRDETGAPMEAHEGIVEPDEWWRLQDVLDGRTPVVRQTRRSVPRSWPVRACCSAACAGPSW